MCCTSIGRARSRPAGALFLAGLLLSGPAAALPEGVQVHGFASQALILTSENNYYGDSQDGGSLDFTELGLNGSWQATPNLQFAGQALVRRAGETDNGKLRLDFGLVDYGWQSQQGDAVGVRAGRVKLPFGLYNTTRDVAHTRPGIFMPPSVYFESLRTLFLSFDGAGLYGELRRDWGDLFIDLYGGRLQADDPEVKRFIGRTQLPGELNSDRLLGGRIAYEWQGGRVRAAVSLFQPELSYMPAAVDFFPRASAKFDAQVYSLQYNSERWGLTAEYLRLDTHARLAGLPPSPTSTSVGYYLQGTYRVRPSVELFTRYDVQDLNTDDDSGNFLNYGRGWTFGARWDLTPNLMLRAEYQRTNGASWLPAGDNPDPAAIDPKWSLFALSVSYRF